MPYKSEAQRKYFNANREKLEAEGVDVDEWNESSKGKKLPEKAEKKSSILTDIIGDPFENKRKQEEEQEKLDKAVARNMRERLARRIAKEKMASEKSAVFGTLIGGPIGAGLGARKARDEGRPMGHGAEEGFLRGMLTGGGAGVGTSLGLLGSAALMKGEPSTGKGVLAALLPLLGAGVGGYTGFRTGKPIVDQFRASRRELQDAVDEAKEDSDTAYEEAKMDRMESEIENLAKAAAFVEFHKEAGKLDFLMKGIPAAAGGAWDLGKKLFKGKTVTQTLPETAGFAAGSVGDVAMDKEQRQQLMSGKVPTKLWDPDESTAHNFENLWRRGFTGLATGSISSPRFFKNVGDAATANLAKKNKAMQEALGDAFVPATGRSAGDFATALGKESIPKVTSLGLGYAPGVIMSTGEVPDIIRRTGENVESVTEDLQSATKGDEGIAEQLKNITSGLAETSSETAKRVNDFGKLIADTRKNITSEGKGVPKLLEALTSTADEATKTVGETGGALKDIASASTAMQNLAENMPTKKDVEGYGEKINERLTDITGGAASRADAWGQRADAVGKTLKDWAPWIGGGLAAGGGLYGLYKIMESRRKAKEEEKKERKRMLYARPDSYPRLKAAGVEYFRRNTQ